MAFRFKLNEPIENEIRRIALEQIDRAVAHLVSDDPRPTAVHGARKCIKRVRALLRLARVALGDETFKRENIRFRDIGRGLSAARDEAVLLQTVDRMMAAAGRRPNASLAKLHHRLTVEMNPSSLVSAEQAARLEATASLAQARETLAALSLDAQSFDSLAAGLKLSLRRAAGTFAVSNRDPSDENVHEWRKGVQLHWRHMALLERAWPELAAARREAARELSAILGEHNDLALLSSHLATHEAFGLSAKERGSLTKLVAARQQAIRNLARPLGERLVADRPGGLAERFTAYWHAAERIKILAKEHAPPTALRDPSEPTRPSRASTTSEPPTGRTPPTRKRRLTA